MHGGKSIRQLIIEGENDTLDFKNTISNAAKIAKTMVAFSNNKGGILLIGIADDGSIKGIKDEDEEVYMIKRAATQFSKPMIEPSFEEIMLEEKLVLKVTIPNSDVKPHYALDEQGKWWAYIRVQDKSILASPTVLEVLKTAEIPALINYSDDHKKLFDYLQEHPDITLKQFSKLTRLAHKRAQKILAALVIAGALKVHINEKTEFFTP